MKIKMSFILCLILTFGLFDANGQKLIKKGELYYQNAEFNKAAEQYILYLKEHENDYKTMALLAESLASSGDLAQADFWYKKIPASNGIDPELLKKHGDVLKKMGYYKEALEKYSSFKNFNHPAGAHNINSCEYAISVVKNPPSHEIIILPINSNGSDFGLTFYKNMPVFSSFRQDIVMTEVENELAKNDLSQRSFIYNAEKSRLLYIKGPEGKLNQIGPVSFNQDGLKCAIIESKSIDGNSFVQYPKSARLLIADVNEKGEITTFKPFKYNEVGSSINSAHLAFGGTALYFSSDRNGGQGGYDLYVSYYTDQDWSLPENLGKIINSSGNEITPFLRENELYFSSDFYPGLGGYDIFASKAENGSWMIPSNKGYGINSSADDYFPSFNNLDEFFLTTNRLGGKGNNDIYKVFETEPAPQDEVYADVPAAVSLDALAAETEKPIVMEEILSPNTAGNENKTEANAFLLPEFNASKVGSNADAMLSILGAYRVALQEFMPDTEVLASNE